MTETQLKRMYNHNSSIHPSTWLFLDMPISNLRDDRFILFLLRAIPVKSIWGGGGGGGGGVEGAFIFG